MFTLLACAPTYYRVPGPLASLGRESSSEWVLRPADRPVRPVRPERPSRAPDAPSPGMPTAIAAAAAGFVGDSSLVVDGARYRWDCSGFVEAALASAGCMFTGSSADLFEQAKERHVLHRRRMPSPGDIAFFDDTYDRNGNGRLDDALSHVAVVQSVEKDGTITLVHLGSRGPAFLRMNLRHPEEQKDADGVVLNDILRLKKRGDSPRTRYLAGELWVAFASYWDAPPDDQVATAERSTK